MNKKKPGRPAKVKPIELTPLKDEIVIDLTQEATNEQELPSQGLGDTIKKITNIFKMPQCDACKKRQQDYNKLFPYYKASREFTQEEVDRIKEITSKMQLTNDEVHFLFNLYNTIFDKNAPIKFCNGCPGLVMKVIQKLNELIPEK